MSLLAAFLAHGRHERGEIPRVSSQAAALTDPHSTSKIIHLVQQLLDENGRVRNAIGLSNDRDRSLLMEALLSLETHAQLGEDSQTTLAAPSLLEVHARRAAFCLWLEAHRAVPWSIRDYDERSLSLLLGYESLRSASALQLRMLNGIDIVHRRQTWLRSTRKETVSEAFNWIRTNIIHRSVGDPDPYSADEMLDGGPWGSCHNTGDLMAAMLNAVNIPARTATYSVEVRGLLGHRYLDLPSEQLFVDHCDAPYDRSLIHIAPPKIIYSSRERATYLELLDARPADLPRFMLLRNMVLLGSHPNRQYMKAACIGPISMRNTIYGFYGCTGATCMPPSTYSEDVDRIISETRAGILKRAVDLGICAELF
jgi:hypothetical protein